MICTAVHGSGDSYRDHSLAHWLVEKSDQHIRSSLIPFYRIQFTILSFQVLSHNLCISVFSNSIVEMNCGFELNCGILYLCSYC